MFFRIKMKYGKTLRAVRATDDTAKIQMFGDTTIFRVCASNRKKFIPNSV